MNPDDGSSAQIADFALSFFVDTGDTYLPDFKTVNGTPSPWYAPELQSQIISPLRRTFATDTFTFGCVCIEVSALC